MIKDENRKRKSEGNGTRTLEEEKEKGKGSKVKRKKGRQKREEFLSFKKGTKQYDKKKGNVRVMRSRSKQREE